MDEDAPRRHRSGCPVVPRVGSPLVVGPGRARPSPARLLGRAEGQLAGPGRSARDDRLEPPPRRRREAPRWRRPELTKQGTLDGGGLDAQAAVIDGRPEDTDPVGTTAHPFADTPTAPLTTSRSPSPRRREQGRPRGPAPWPETANRAESTGAMTDQPATGGGHPEPPPGDSTGRAPEGFEAPGRWSPSR